MKRTPGQKLSALRLCVGTLGAMGLAALAVSWHRPDIASVAAQIVGSISMPIGILGGAFLGAHAWTDATAIKNQPDPAPAAVATP